MAKPLADPIIVSYNDAVLRQSDLSILFGPHFLNDRIIEFYFSYLSATLLHPLHDDDVLLVPPSISFWIKECPDAESFKDFVEPLHLSRRKLIIFPINDSVDVTLAEGGCHWSLLAYVRERDAFVHHDSSRGINVWHAKRVYKSLVPYVDAGATYLDCPDSPQQVNGYDCGLYVLAIAREICEWYAATAGEEDGRRRKDNVEGLWFAAVKKKVTPTFVSKMRKTVLELVKSLMVKTKTA